jgi:hypothetical protein
MLDSVGASLGTMQALLGHSPADDSARIEPAMTRLAEEPGTVNCGFRGRVQEIS